MNGLIDQRRIASDAAFSEGEELELASQALEAVDPARLDQFVAVLVRRAQRRLGPLDPQASAALTQYLRSVARKVLAAVIRRSSSLPGTTPSSASSKQATKVFGIETEGLSNEDAELEVARRFVRFGGSASRRLNAQPRRRPARIRVRAAILGAARRHAPGLVSPTALVPATGTAAQSSQHSSEQGRHITVVNCCSQCASARAEDTAATSLDSTSTPTGSANAASEPTQPKENSMHDIDRTQTKLDSELEFGELESQFGNEFETDRELEYGQELEVAQELEQQEYGQELEFGQELEYGQEMEFGQELQTETQTDLEGVFSEAEEMELASELLGVASEAELDMFLGKLLKKAWRGVRKVGSTLGRIAKPLGGILRGVAKAALPMAGGAIGTFFGGPLGTTIGSKLGSTLGNALEMELEGMQQEDREFEVARRIVQVAGTAAAQAANVPSGANPQNAARAAVLNAIRRHAPSAGAASYSGARGRSGRWIRRGNKIVLFGL